MDELRRGIGLRAIGQKDPLVEYQFESFNLFQEMLVRVRESITEFALRVSVVTRNEERPEQQEEDGAKAATRSKCPRLRPETTATTWRTPA